MNHIFQVLLKEKAGLSREKAPLQFGIPLPSGQFFNPRELELTTAKESVLPCRILVTAQWPDNSIKWCLVKSQVNLPANQQLELTLCRKTNDSVALPKIPDLIKETDTDIIVHTQNCQFTLNKKRFNFLEQVLRNGHELVRCGHFRLKLNQNNVAEARVTGFQYQTFSSDAVPVSCEVLFNGAFDKNDEHIANFEARLTFFIATDTVKCSMTLHNPKAALHTAGKWDLGDPDSLFFSSFSIDLGLNQTNEIEWKTEQDDTWKALEQSSLLIYQGSSGGKNWNSPVHKNRFNKLSVDMQGYVCSSGTEQLSHGQRANPSISIKNNTGRINIFVEKFWQNFPKSLGVEDDTAKIGLFPEQFIDGFELQPGEKKTHQFYLDFGEDINALAQFTSPIEVSLNPRWIERCKVFPNFLLGQEEDPLQMIISQGLTCPDNFFNKREKIDEYGWRNFGDIFADHETDGYQGEELFISHYNNQYDPIYGFLRQYALTGNNQWFELADDLARHVVDIDIYHTEYDKEEYNGGLFWHTDHYLPAETSSHRSYSKYQKNNAYEDHAGGGGPGGQHCYTTGLLYHYLLTGNINSKNAVIKLTNWISCYYEGSGTFLNFLIFLKNSNRHDLKNIKTGHYPLDRGTGNYINALLDDFVLTRQHSMLGRVENIIKNTVHPLDNISQRQLENVEITWFYTVFFQSLCRYLSTKEELSEFDEPFYYARDSLLHYADWMVENEYPYLQKPEILEFPNHTWTAQDIRKVNILLLSAYYAPEWESRYADKAQEIYSYIVKNLSHDKTRCYTRILSILMQNQGVANFSSHITAKNSFLIVSDYQPTQEYGFALAFKHILKALLKVIMQFSLSKEIQWACRRSQKLARLLGYRP